MKKHLIKFISVVLICILMMLSLTSCGLLDNGEKNSDEEQKGTSDEGKKGQYYAVKTLFTYDDVMEALAIVRERREVAPVYTVSDMGDGYTVIYQFSVPNCRTVYPVDYDTYFTTKSNGDFLTCIFLEDQVCPGHRGYSLHGCNLIHAYKGDEDYETLINLNKSYASVWVKSSEEINVEEIEIVELLSYKLFYIDDGAFYLIKYCGETIMEVRSCVELDDDFFEALFNSIVTTRTK
jgi:hypothetical protein